ncbi:hypothetical protein ABOM_011034 [Aspergillus bombycis]|uniref:Zn(2)-C6 fungal-type domain-containing protein n=1 Tax=Aspergillus bombycis TaxID=109264 RepID=A0A1F7ZMP0_9EURO|nr:hypothetical protein ABOM_011034 [Aspergillus bombycis]OGM40720.1 hypothetical protein ABOM_011034 [Aspergillus bombycis]
MDGGDWSGHPPPGTAKASPLRQAKRRKIAVACETCRARKVRCDGQRPTCGPCLTRAEYYGIELDCVYSRSLSERHASSNPRTKRQPTRPQTPSPYRACAHQVEARQRPSIPSGNDPVTSSHQPAGSPDDRNPCTISPFMPYMPAGSQRRPNSREGVNAMVGEVAADERCPPQGFFGSSSAGGFMRQIRVAVEKEVPSSGIPNPQASPLDRNRAKEPSTPGIISNHVLPSRRMGDHLMEIYWEFVFPLYPFFDRKQLSAEYLTIWNGKGSPSDEDMLMCTFNLIFALGCQLSQTIEPENRAATADSFFSRAKHLIQINIWQPSSTPLVQCLLLMSQYLQSTDHADQCWIVTGMAIRGAQSLGLHLPETSARLASDQGKELLRRIWHGCVLMDRVVALTLGRPTMISKEAAGAVALPTMVDEEVPPSLAESHTQGGTERPSFITFYAKCLELYEILNDILLSLYLNSDPPDRPGDHHTYYFQSFHEGQVTVFRLDHALTVWSQSLPSVFRSQFTPLPANHVIEDSLPQRFALQCSIVCVKSAQDLIDMTYTNLPPANTIGLLPAWWYNILYVYTAGTVLMAGRLHQAILAELTEESVGQTWQRALEILRKYRSYSSSAQRCIVALELLYEKVSASINVRQSFPPLAPGNPAHEASPGEGLSEALLDTLDLPDFFDMSWLNSVPSSLY